MGLGYHRLGPAYSPLGAIFCYVSPHQKQTYPTIDLSVLLNTGISSVLAQRNLVMQEICRHSFNIHEIARQL
jgi:hypothetical protein